MIPLLKGIPSALIYPLMIAISLLWAGSVAVFAQPLGNPDEGAPGDQLIRNYLAQESQRLSDQFSDDLASLPHWMSKRDEYLSQYMYMLGLDPRPESTPLNATITGTLKGDGYVVDLLHYQSMPGLYVTGNLYRPANVSSDQKLPAVFYVCGHSGRGRDGNKVAYQSHGIWFAKHGYVCLVVDTLQLGEIAAIHHGTYNLQRWWWHSRGYTPAGVEAWNGIRGIDYLISRKDVDPDRIAVTGISGGGAATFWIAAADERVRVAVPVSGMADLQSYVPNRVINGHCDCMFMYNTFQWPWTRIAGLVAPRPMLFVNSDQDGIFPMDANERVINRLERLYSLYQAGDQVDAVVSVGGHAYRKDIRQAVYRFVNSALKHDAQLITDSETDIVSEGRDPGPYPIPPEKLRVFPDDADIPADQKNTVIDEHFVPLAAVRPPESGRHAEWKERLLSELKRVSFASFPKDIPAAIPVTDNLPFKPPAAAAENTVNMYSEAPLSFQLRFPDGQPLKDTDRASVLLVVLTEKESGTTPEWIQRISDPEQKVILCEPRGTGATRWTTKNPPNYIRRSHALLGRTIETGRIRDVIAAARYLGKHGDSSESSRSVVVAGKGEAGILAAYAALLEPSIAGVRAVAPQATHMDNEAPQLLNVLRVCDIPDVFGMLAPRSLTIIDAPGTVESVATTAYEAADALNQLRFTKLNKNP